MANPDAPGQQKVLHIQNTDPSKPTWQGTRAEYNANKKELQAQGYYLSDEDAADTGTPAPTPHS